MTEPETPIIDFDDPDKLVRAGDVLKMLETDRDLARAVAEHHKLLRSPDTPIDMVNLARYICFALTEGEIEQTRRLYGEAAVDRQKINRDLTNDEVPLQKKLADRLRFLSLKTPLESDVGGASVV